MQCHNFSACARLSLAPVRVGSGGEKWNDCRRLHHWSLCLNSCKPLKCSLTACIAEGCCWESIYPLKVHTHVDLSILKCCGHEVMNDSFGQLSWPDLARDNYLRPLASHALRWIKWALYKFLDTSCIVPQRVEDTFCFFSSVCMKTLDRIVLLMFTAIQTLGCGNSLKFYSRHASRYVGILFVVNWWTWLGINKI